VNVVIASRVADARVPRADLVFAANASYLATFATAADQFRQRN